MVILKFEKKNYGTSLKVAKIENVFSFWSFPQNREG